jgi:pimeloyl-ACP methyl ester carboxylesterase
MAARIRGPLHYERMGPEGPLVAFIHPNPMDQSCWIFQLAHFSTWYRCVAIDLPGYGRSPMADEGLTMEDIADACWEAVDDAFGAEPAILVGCSVGAAVAPYMYHHSPARTRALVLTGTGYVPGKEFTVHRRASYRDKGVDFRWEYAFQDMSPAFQATPLAHWFADLFVERNRFADVPTIIRQFEALARPDPPDHHSAIKCPTIILTGTEDGAHATAAPLKERIPGSELHVLPGAGHACQLEQPWLFDRLMIRFLAKHGLFPGRTASDGALD